MSNQEINDTRRGYTLEVLRLAREFLDDPKHWIQDEYFLDQHGDQIDPAEITTKWQDATCCCSVGAVYRACAQLELLERKFEHVSGVSALSEPTSTLAAATWALGDAALMDKQFAASIDGNTQGDLAVIYFNDRTPRTHSEIIAMFDRAIAKLEARR